MLVTMGARITAFRAMRVTLFTAVSTITAFRGDAGHLGACITAWLGDACYPRQWFLATITASRGRCITALRRRCITALRVAMLVTPQDVAGPSGYMYHGLPGDAW